MFMNPGLERLLELLRGAGLAPAMNETEVLEVLTLAEQQNVLPFVSAQLNASAGELPEAVRTRLAKSQRDAAVAAFFWSAELRGLLRTFGAAGIALMPLKGPWLAQRVYGGVALRRCRDLDLLVRKTDLAAAEELLRSIGFTPNGWGDDYHRPWRRGSCGVELHFHVENPVAIDFGLEEAWGSARQASFGGEPAWQMTAADEVLFLALHGVRHRYDRLSLVLDLALAAERFGPEVWSGPDRVRHDRRLRTILELGETMAGKLRPNALKDRRVPSAHVAGLAERLWEEMLASPRGELDWEAQHRFYVDLESTPMGRLSARLRHLRILAGRLIGPDYDFAERFGLRRPWQVWMMRPVRLLAVRAGLAPRNP
jgi:hypothetical protein